MAWQAGRWLWSKSQECYVQLVQEHNLWQIP